MKDKTTFFKDIEFVIANTGKLNATANGIMYVNIFWTINGYTEIGLFPILYNWKNIFIPTSILIDQNEIHMIEKKIL